MGASMRIVNLNSNAPIAAIDGEPPDLVGIEIGAVTLTAGDTSQVLRRLTSLAADRQTVLSCEGKLSLMIGGYDSDVRAVPQIAEFGTYMKVLISAWPYFGWFCMLNDDLPDEFRHLAGTPAAPDHSLLNIVLAGACEYLPPSPVGHQLQKPIRAISFNRDVIVENATALLAGVLRLGDLHRIEVRAIDKRFAKLERMLERNGVLA